MADWICSYGVRNCPACKRPSRELKAERIAPLERYNTAVPDNFRVWLNVPFSQKNTAKALGARWDIERKAWYCDKRGNTDKFRRWIPVIRTVPKRLEPREMEIAIPEPATPKPAWTTPKLIEERPKGIECDIFGILAEVEAEQTAKPAKQQVMQTVTISRNVHR